MEKLCSHCRLDLSPTPKLQNKPAFLGRPNAEYSNQRVKGNSKAKKQKEAAEYINPRRSYVGKDTCLWRLGKKIFGEQKKSFQIILSLAQNSLRSLCHSKQTLSCWKGTIRSEEQFCSSKGNTTAITSEDELRLSKFKTADFSLYIWIFTYLM